MQIKEIRYFSRDGKSMPNGIGFQRGNFLHECKNNREAFVLDENIHNEAIRSAALRGGIIVFPSDADTASLESWLTSEKGNIGAFSVGNAFRGKYVGGNSEEFGDHSTTIEVGGLSTRELLNLAGKTARFSLQGTVLVKDLNKNKIYIVTE